MSQPTHLQFKAPLGLPLRTIDRQVDQTGITLFLASGHGGGGRKGPTRWLT